VAKRLEKNSQQVNQTHVIVVGIICGMCIDLIDNIPDLRTVAVGNLCMGTCYLCVTRLGNRVAKRLEEKFPVG
jgi:hypothetical protein